VLEESSALKELKKLEPRLSFSPKLPTSVLLSNIVSSERKLASALLRVKREWRDVVGTWGCTIARCSPSRRVAAFFFDELAHRRDGGRSVQLGRSSGADA
jgi:hypothetical protein